MNLLNDFFPSEAICSKYIPCGNFDTSTWVRLLFCSPTFSPVKSVIMTLCKAIPEEFRIVKISLTGFGKAENVKVFLLSEIPEKADNEYLKIVPNPAEPPVVVIP